MPKFRVTIREARWHSVTYEVNTDDFEVEGEPLTQEDVEDCPFDYEPEDAAWEEGDVLSIHGETTVEEIK